MGIAKQQDPVDDHVGSRVRQRRLVLGMSQSKLGKALNLTFQKIQKYERGTNRIGASRIYKLSQILDVPVSFFFDDMPDMILKNAILMPDSVQQKINIDQMASREALELTRSYYSIEDLAIRKKLFEVVKAVGKSNFA